MNRAQPGLIISDVLDAKTRWLAGERPRAQLTERKLFWRLQGDDIQAGLRAVQALRHLIDVHEERLVRLARRQGLAWHDIALDLRVSRQAAAKRFSHRLNVDPWVAD